MKHSSLAFILIFSFAAISAQLPSSLESEENLARSFDPDQIPKVEVELLNYDPQKDTALNIGYTLSLFLNSDPNMTEPKIQADGTFHIELSHAFPYQSFYLEFRSKYINKFVVQEGLTISFDLDQLNKKRYGYFPTVTGPDKELNEYLKRQLIYSAQQRSNMRGKIYQALREEEMSSAEKAVKIEALFAEARAFDAKYFEKYPNEYDWIVKDELELQYFQHILSAYRGEKIPDSLLDKLIAYQPAIMDFQTLSFYSELTHQAAHISPETRMAISRKVLEKNYTGESEREELDRFWEEYKKKLDKAPYDSLFFQETESNYLIPLSHEIEAEEFSQFLQELSQMPKSKEKLLLYAAIPSKAYARESYLQRLIPLIEDGHFRNKLLEIEEETKAEINELDKLIGKDKEFKKEHPFGTQILELEGKGPLYVSNHQEVEEFIATVREVHKDKAIIFDIWTTWCGPCLVDFKNSKPIKEQMKELPVKVIYLCMEDNAGSNLASWKETVASKGSEGDHILLPRSFARKFMDHFDFNFYPSYIFMDREGKLDKKFIQRISGIDLDKLKKRL